MLSNQVPGEQLWGVKRSEQKEPFKEDFTEGGKEKWYTMFLNLNKLFCSHLRGTGAQCYVLWAFIQTLTHPHSGEVSVGQVATGTSNNI